MIILGTIEHALAASAGFITAVVSWRVMRKYLGIDSPSLGICIGFLSSIGLASHEGGLMTALLIPYEALGFAILVMLFLMPFLKGKKGKGVKPLPPPRSKKTKLPDDPWEQEIRSGGRLMEQFGIKRKQ